MVCLPERSQNGNRKRGTEGDEGMKILVYGAGVLGCNLARNLLRAGKDVTLLARGNWAAEIKQNGLRIKDKFSPCTSVSRIPVVTELAPDATYDVIFVVLRYTQLDSVLYTLRANRTKNIVFVGNNVQARALAAALPGKNVLFAFALSAGHRESDRVVSIDLKKITIGQLPGTAANKQLIGRIFHGTKYKVAYEPNMEDYLLCHAAFVMPAAFACYKTDGDLKKLRGDTAYLNRVLDANIEGYRAIRNAGHTILPKEDADFEGEKYRRTCLRFFKLMCATSLGKLCASDHAMNAINEMSALNRDLRKFFDEHGAAYPVWPELESGQLRDDRGIHSLHAAAPGGGQADGLLRKIHDDSAHAVVLPQERKKQIHRKGYCCYESHRRPESRRPQPLLVEHGVLRVPGWQRLRGTLYQVRYLCADEGAGTVRPDPCFVPSGLHHERGGRRDGFCAAVHPCLRRTLL